MIGSATPTARFGSNPAAWSALLLLAAATAMAALVSGARRSLPLGPAVTPQGWHIAFQPPRDWALRSWPGAAAFQEPLVGRHRPRILVVQEIHGPAADPTDVVRRWRQELGFSRVLDRFGATPPPAFVQRIPFGPLPGAWLEDDDRGLVVAAGLDGDIAFTVGILGGALPISRRDRQIVSEVVDSIRFLE